MDKNGNFASEVGRRLIQADRKWFDQVLKTAPPSVLDVVRLSASGCSLEIEGAIRTYVPIYIPLIISSESRLDIDFSTDAIQELLGRNCPEGMKVKVFPGLKSLQESLDMDPVAARSLAQEMSISIHDGHEMRGCMPFDDEQDLHRKGNIYLYAGVLHACLYGQQVSVNGGSLGQISIGNRCELCNMVADEIAMTNGMPPPVVHMGDACSFRNLDEVALEVMNFTSLHAWAKQGVAKAVFSFMYPSPCRQYLHYIVRDGRGHRMQEMKVLMSRSGALVKQGQYIFQKMGMACVFEGGLQH